MKEIQDALTQGKITKRQADALVRHKQTHGHTDKHIKQMIALMLKGHRFLEAHRQTMKTHGT